MRRIDPGSGRLDRRVVAIDDPSELAVGGGAVWALGGDGDTVIRIDPAGPAARGEPTPVAAGAGARLAAGAGAAWVTSAEGAPLQRLGY